MGNHIQVRIGILINPVELPWEIAYKLESEYCMYSFMRNILKSCILSFLEQIHLTSSV